MLLDGIPAEVVAGATLHMLDARDLLALDEAMGGQLHTLLPPRRGVFTATRSLSPAERRWLSARGVSIVTLVKQHLIEADDCVFSKNPWSNHYTKLGELELFAPIVSWTTLDDVHHRDDGGAAIESFSDGGGGGGGMRIWMIEGCVHRDGDRPAMERSSDGARAWFRHGQLHRDGDRPAVERPDGGHEYWRHGKRHRAGYRPAVERANGEREWWYHGERLSVLAAAAAACRRSKKKKKVSRAVHSSPGLK